MARLKALAHDVALTVAISACFLVAIYALELLLPNGLGFWP